MISETRTVISMTQPLHSGILYCMGRLYVVATPIGNLGDITQRALKVLRSADAIACEDTRHSRRLLTHFGISAPLISCRNQAPGSNCLRGVLDFLGDDADVAYISDAGTPGVSDPGSTLVREVRSAGHAVIPIPGASAVTALLSVSGIAGRGWFFEGFLPPKGAKRIRRLTELAERREAFVLYEAPHRIVRLFEELREVVPRYETVIGRELTKLHEQISTGTVDEIAQKLESGGIPVRGEFLVLVWPGKND